MPERVADGGGDLVGAANRGLKDAVVRIGFGGLAAGLGFDCLLDPIGAAAGRANHILPIQARSSDHDRHARGGFAIQVGDNVIDLERGVKFHEIALAVQPDIQAGGMHQQAGRTGPGLTVYIHDSGLGHHALRAWSNGWVALRVEVQAQVVCSGGVCLAGKGFSLARVDGRKAVEFSIDPPWCPLAEGIVRPVGWRIIGGAGGDLPGDIRIRQTTAGIIFGIHSDNRLIAGIVRGAGFITGGDFKFGGAELLHLEEMHELAASQA